MSSLEITNFQDTLQVPVPIRGGGGFEVRYDPKANRNPKLQWRKGRVIDGTKEHTVGKQEWNTINDISTPINTETKIWLNLILSDPSTSTVSNAQKLDTDVLLAITTDRGYIMSSHVGDVILGGSSEKFGFQVLLNYDKGTPPKLLGCGVFPGYFTLSNDGIHTKDNPIRAEYSTLRGSSPQPDEDGYIKVGFGTGIQKRIVIFLVIDFEGGLIYKAGKLIGCRYTTSESLKQEAFRMLGREKESDRQYLPPVRYVFPIAEIVESYSSTPESPLYEVIQVHLGSVHLTADPKEWYWGSLPFN